MILIYIIYTLNKSYFSSLALDDNVNTIVTINDFTVKLSDNSELENAFKNLALSLHAIIANTKESAMQTTQLTHEISGIATVIKTDPKL